MSPNVEELFVVLVMLVPGFVVIRVRGAFRPVPDASQSEQFISGMLWGIIINGIVFVTYLLPKIRLDDQNVGQLREAIKALEVDKALIYFGCLYTLASVWGAILGLWRNFSVREIANKLGLTKFSSQYSVWARIIQVHTPADRPEKWVKFLTRDKRTIFGRLANWSALVEQDKPIEVWLRPVFELSNGRWTRLPDGLYAKLTENQVVEFHFHEKSWMPEIADVVSQ